MTVFDDRLYRVLQTLADPDGQVRRSIRDLADLLDVSQRSIRDALARLERDQRIHRVSNTGGLSDPTIYAFGAAGDLTEGLRSRAGAAANGAATQRKTDPPVSRAPAAETPKRDVNPDCPVCEGTGWVMLAEPANTVEPCRCISDDWRAYWAGQRRRFARTWPKPPRPDEAPSRPDFTATYLELCRRRLRGED